MSPGFPSLLKAEVGIYALKPTPPALIIADSLFMDSSLPLKLAIIVVPPVASLGRSNVSPARGRWQPLKRLRHHWAVALPPARAVVVQIGRASCRERG